MWMIMSRDLPLWLDRLGLDDREAAAYCNCGWDSGDVDSMQEADAALQGHYREVAGELHHRHQ